jgi:methylmalonyl-CoA mutase, N-terminal domain
MYAGRPWTIRQLSGAGSPEDVNRRVRFLLDEGATGISVLFDVPTIQMYDSDEPESAGMVGVVGAPIDTVDDMAALFKDIALDKVSVSLVTHYPSNTAILMGMYLALAERRGIPWASLRGSVQNDFIMEEVVRAGPAFIPPRACFRLQCENMAYLVENCPKWNVATFNGYNLREYGATLELESAVALANAYESYQRFPPALERMAFFWCVRSDFFMEVARLRAVREIWYELTGAKLRCHCQTSGISLQRAEPLNNIARASFQALAAIFGGCQSLHVDAWDEAYAAPTPESSLVALRTQQILQVETGVMRAPDPLGGAPYVEAITEEVKRGIRQELDWIANQGGIEAVVETGALARECERGQRFDTLAPVGDGAEVDIQPLKALVRRPCARQTDPIRDVSFGLGGCVAWSRQGYSIGQMRRALLAHYGTWERP